MPRSRGPMFPARGLPSMCRKPDIAVRSRIPALLAAGGLALVTTACGGGADEAPSEKKDEQKQEAAAKPRDIFALLGSKTADMTNYRIDIEMTVEDDELEGTFRPTFTYQVQDDPKSVLAEIDMGDEYRDVVAEEMGEFLTGVDPEALSTFTILKADDEVYLKNPHGIHGDADWVTVASKKDLEEMPDIDFQAFVVLTEVLAGAEDVADDGTEEITGRRPRSSPVADPEGHRRRRRRGEERGPGGILRREDRRQGRLRGVGRRRQRPAPHHHEGRRRRDEAGVLRLRQGLL